MKSRALEKKHNIFIAGWTYYILHNAACKSGSTFATVNGFDIVDHCVDLFYWFHKSSKRKSILKEYYEFCNSECEEFIKYVSTRWLCLERCVNWELKKYAGLKSYFLSEGLHDKRFKCLEESLRIQWWSCICFFPIKHRHIHQFSQISTKRITLDIQYLRSHPKLLWKNLPLI